MRDSSVLAGRDPDPDPDLDPDPDPDPDQRLPGQLHHAPCQIVTPETPVTPIIPVTPVEPVDPVKPVGQNIQTTLAYHCRRVQANKDSVQKI